MHLLQIDDYEFVIQKKGVAAIEVFKNIEPKEIELKIKLLVELVMHRCRKGICDGDKAFIQNVAFLEDKVFFTDIGQFYEDQNILNEEAQAQDLRRRFDNFYSWLYDNFPAVLRQITLYDF